MISDTCYVGVLYCEYNCLLCNIANTIGLDLNYLSNLRSSEYEEEVSWRRKLPRELIRRYFLKLWQLIRPRQTVKTSFLQRDSR